MGDPLPFLHDVQTGVVRGINSLYVAYLFFRITDRQKFVEHLPKGPNLEGGENGLGIGGTVFYSEAWRVPNQQSMDRSVGDDASAPRAQQSKSEPPLFISFANVAFTYSGLRALNVHESTLASFPQPFRDGMAQRAAALGDTGVAAPESWDGYLGSREIHGVAWGSFLPTVPLLAFPFDFAELYRRLTSTVTSSIPLEVAPSPPWPHETTSAAPKANGFSFTAAPIPGAEVLHAEFGMANYRFDNAKKLPHRIEHFGFRDGISQPYADIGLNPPPPGGGTPRAGGSWAPVARGEILLGHPDEDNNVQHLPANQQLRNNGAYMVFRKLKQDVVGFRNFMKRRDHSGVPDRLASQMVGRWPDGSSLVRSPNGPDGVESAPPTQTVNDFRYQADDSSGERCPIGAHIRRANPRDTNDRDEARRHRLFRRSMSYGGARLAEGDPDDGVERGLLFITMQARIDRQFEHVQANWLNRGELVGQAGAQLDPLTGPHAGRTGDAFHAAGQPAPITNLPRFVTPRGGDYFFVPSFTALAGLKAGCNFAPDDPSAPMPSDAIGSILPSRTDNSSDLTKLGMRLLADGQPSYAPLPPITTTPFPGGPAQQINTVVVGRYDYVRDVLKDDCDFSNDVFDQHSRAITGGQRLLIGLPADDAERTKRLKVLHDALALLGPLPVDQTARGLMNGVLDRVLPTGRLDVVADVGRVIPILAVGVLFGIAGPGFVSPTGVAALFGRFDVTDVPDDWLRTLPAVEDYAKPLTTMQTWTRLSFLQIFVNLANAQDITALAERAARELLRHIDALVLNARATAGSGQPRTLLEALVRVPLDPTDGPDPGRHIRLLLTEFAAGAVETLNAALTNAINYFLDHKQELKHVLCDYLGKRVVCKDDTTLDKLIKMLNDQEIDILIYEILRFDPMGPLAFRTCVQPNVSIGDVPVDPKTVVCLVTAAAMMDPRVFPCPETIRFDRPLDKYLHFGVGLHQCAGQMIVPFAMPMLREMFRAIASLPRLRRAAGAAGAKRQTFPLLSDGLTVRFEPPVA
jgi:Dyp-type peroxidase family